jgi:hypothetical protein
MIMSRRSIVVAIFVLAFAFVATAADDPFVGTWKLNVAKSKVSDPSQALKSCLVKVEGRANGIKFMADVVVASDGKTGHTKFEAKYDGKDYPVTEDPDCDTVALKKIDSNTLDWLWPL